MEATTYKNKSSPQGKWTWHRSSRPLGLLDQLASKIFSKHQSLEKPCYNVQHPLTNPLHSCQDWKRMQGSPSQVTMLLTPPMEAEEVAALANLGLTQVHPFRAVVPVGLAPHSLGDEWHCCHSHSCSSQRRAYLQADKNQQSSDPNDSVPGATQGSPVTTCYSSPLATSSPSMETSMEGAIV